MFRANFSTSEPFFKCATLHLITRPSVCHPIWDISRASCSFVAALCARLSIYFMNFDDTHLWAWHIEGRFDQFTLQTAFLQSDHGRTSPDTQHYFKGREGTIPLEVHTISRGSGGHFSLVWLPWAILHTPLLSLSNWCGCAPSFIVHNSSYLLGAHNCFAIFISSFWPCQLFPQEPHCH